MVLTQAWLSQGTCAICPPALSQQLLWGLAFLYQSQCLSGWQAVGSQALGPGAEEGSVDSEGTGQVLKLTNSMMPPSPVLAHLLLCRLSL